MKICLIYPPAIGAVRAMMIQTEGDEGGGIGFKPPLGLLYIAGYLKSVQPHHELMVIDAQVERLDFRQVTERAAGFRPDVIGITAWTDFWYSTHRLMEELRQALPQAHICVGGPHVGIYPGITLEHSTADSIVMGDGEVPFSMLVQALERGGEMPEIPGAYFKGRAAAHYEFYIHKDLDGLPNPDRTLLPYRRYSSALGKKKYLTTMVTSRGCPYKCVFCKLNFQKTLCRSAENVVSEFAQITKLGIGDIELYDDTFTWSRQRVIDICKGILDRGIKVTWAVRDRVSNADAGLLDWMWKAGCRRIHYGVESGLDKTLEAIKKRITTAQARYAVKMAKARGFEVLTYFMLGLPGETEADMRATIDFALELDPDYTTFNVAIPYAGTGMYESGLQNGVIPNDFWLEFAKKPAPGYVVPHFYEEHLGRLELLRMRDYAVSRFYFRPLFMLRQLGRVGGMREFRGKLKMAALLFKESVLGRSHKTYGKAR